MFSTLDHHRTNMASVPSKSMWGVLAGPFKEFGIAVGALYAIDRMLGRISPNLRLYVYEMMVQPLGGQPFLPPNLSKDLSFAEIGRDHPAVALMPALPAIKATRFDQGAICLGVFRRDKLIGYAWFCFNAYDEDEVRCKYELAMPEQSVFDFDFYVLPEHRMGIGFLAVWHGANEYMRARNIRYTFSRLTRFNLASRRAHAHLGWKCVGKAAFLKAWQIEIMLATMAPYASLSWSGDNRPVLRLRPDKLQATDSAQKNRMR